MLSHNAIPFLKVSVEGRDLIISDIYFSFWNEVNLLVMHVVWLLLFRSVLHFVPKDLVKTLEVEGVVVGNMRVGFVQTKNKVFF